MSHVIFIIIKAEIRICNNLKSAFFTIFDTKIGEKESVF